MTAHPIDLMQENSIREFSQGANILTDLQNQNLTVARTFVEQFLGEGDMSVAEKILHENVQAITGLKPTGPIDGREEYKQVFSAFFDAFPPTLDLVIEDIFAANDRVVVRFRSEQKHVKDFFGVAATNRIITLIETHVMRLNDGKIVENVVSATNLEFEMLMAPVLISTRAKLTTHIKP